MIGGRTLGTLTSGSALVAAMILLALVGVALIARAELAPEGTSTQSGVFGYLVIQAAGVLGLLAHRERRAVAWAAVALAALLLANSAVFFAIDAGLFGPWIALIVLNLALVFVSGVLGVLAIIVALALTASEGPRRPPTIPAVVMVLLASSLVGIAFAGESGPPPPPPTATPPPVSPASPSPRPTATPTATPASQRTFPLTVTVVGNGSVLIRAQDITCPGKTCTFQIPAGTVVTLTPQPGSDSIFATWSGCRNPCQLRMDQARAVTASFKLPVLQVRVGGKDRGTVRSTPDGIACPPACEAPFARGTRVTLTAAPAGSAAFTGWTDACSGFGTCQLQMNSSVAAAAQFETLAGPGYDARACSEAGPVQIRQGQTASVLACFINVGTTSWTRGTPTEVELAQCCPLGGPSPLSSWNAGWASERVYADVTNTTVAPGQQANAVFNVRAPKNATLGDHRLDGFLVLARTGAPVAGGAFSIVLTVVP